MAESMESSIAAEKFVESGKLRQILKHANVPKNIIDDVIEHIDFTK